MQAVDVLRDDARDDAEVLELDDRVVPVVRLVRGFVRGRALAPDARAMVGVIDVVVDRELGRVDLLPDAVRAPEVRDAGLGGDAGAGERDRGMRSRESFG